MMARKRIQGEVVYNDGEFAEVETYGLEVYEEDLFLNTIQLHVEDTGDTPEQFRQRFPVGMWLHIWTTLEVNPLAPKFVPEKLISSREVQGQSRGKNAGLRSEQ